MNAIIQDIMRPFGVTPRYAGFPMLVASVELYLEDPNRLSAVIDEIYRPAAKRCRCTSDNVERNIRTIIQQAWRKDPAKLREMAGYTLFTYPKVSEFIEIIARRLRNGKNPPSNPFPFSNPPGRTCAGGPSPSLRPAFAAYRRAKVTIKKSILLGLILIFTLYFTNCKRKLRLEHKKRGLAQPPSQTASRLSLSCPRRGTKGGGGCASIPSQDGFHIFPFKITCRFFTKYSTPE